MNSKQALKVSIVTIGDELISSQVDTNGPAIANELIKAGFDVSDRLVLPDCLDLIKLKLNQLLRSYDVIICCGGLGPTQDDLTREAIAKAIGKKLIEHSAALEKIKGRFKRRHLDMPAINQKQAFIPETAWLLENDQGMAPGFLVKHQHSWIAALPGPPRECLTMLVKKLIPKIKKLVKQPSVLPRVNELRVFGSTESKFQEMIAPLLKPYPEVSLGFLISGQGDVLVKLKIDDKSNKAKQQQLAAATRKVKQTLGYELVSSQGKRVEDVVAGLLLKQKQTLAVAESCTGGLVASRLTAIPGSSGYLKEGLVTYSNEAKSRRLGVPQKTIEKNGAVSKEVAMAMAKGVKRTSQTHWGIGITGIAGPGGGSKEKPVGLVHIAVAGPQGVQSYCCHLQWANQRGVIQQIAATTALDLLRRCLLNQL